MKESEPFTETELERLTLTAQHFISRNLLRDFAEPANIELREELFGEVCIMVRQAIWGQKLAYARIAYPSDWWQHFKERWFPTWAKKKWPVKRETTTVGISAVYPKLAFPREEHSIVLTQLHEGAAEVAIDHQDYGYYDWHSKEENIND